MRARRMVLAVCLLATSLPALLSAPSAWAQSWRSITESFDTRTFRDPLTTTAVWDTVAGELRAVAFASSTLSTTPVGTSIQRVRMINGLAYACTNGSGLIIVDIHNPALPTIAGSWSGTVTVQDVVQFGPLTLCTLGNGNLAILDTSNPASIAFQGYSAVGGTTFGIAREGKNLLIADGTPGLLVVNETAGIIGSVNTPGSARGVDPEGDVVYIADDTGDLRCIDFRNPLAPVEIGSLPLTGTAQAIVVRGDRAYLAMGTGGLAVVNVANPAAPSLAGSLPLAGTADGLDVVGDRAFVATQAGGTRVVDISNPAAPVLLETYPATSSNAALALTDILLVGDVGSLQIRRWASPISPQTVGTQYVGQSSAGVELQGDYAYFASELGGLAVVDISNPTAPAQVGTLQTGDFARGIDVQGNVAYVAMINSGLQSIDITDPTAPTSRDLLSLSFSPRKVAVDGDLAYVVGNLVTSGYLGIVNIADPSNLVAIKEITLPGTGGFINDVDVDPDRVYVSAAYPGLMVVDVTNPASPSVLTTLPSPGGQLMSTVVSGRYAFSVFENVGLAIYDLATLTQVSFTPGIGGEAVDIAGNLLVIAEGFSLGVFDVSNPMSPQGRTSGLSPDNVSALVMDGDRAILATSSGMAISALASVRTDAGTLYGGSRPVDGATRDIGAARLVVDADGGMFFNLALDASPSYVVAGSGFQVLSGTGSDLTWRSFFDPLSPTLPRVRSLRLDWILTAPEITAVSDVPNDQGGWARVRFLRSAYDATSTAEHAPILGYLHRRVDDAAVLSAVREQGATVDQLLHDGGATPLQGFARGLQWHGRRFIEPLPPAAPAGSLARAVPPGLWEVVGFVFATTADQYLALVPTLSDSTPAARPTVYFVSAHTATPGVFYASQPDSVYSIDNIAPGVPTGFHVAYGSAGNALSWNPAPEYDYQFHRVYRGATAGFLPGPGNLVHSVAGTAWTDVVAQPWDWHYKITAVDHAGNESGPATPGQLTEAPPVPAAGVPQALVLLDPVPNPFNPRTELRFELPAPGRVELSIFDLVGRRVRTLIDGDLPAGAHRVVWDGTDDAGRLVASAVFLERLRTWQGERRHKLVLVR